MKTIKSPSFNAHAQEKTLQCLIRRYSLSCAGPGDRETSSRTEPVRLLDRTFTFTSLTLANGKLAIDDYIVHCPVIGHQTIRWSQLSDGIRSTGRIVFREDRLMVFGTISVGLPGQAPHEIRLIGAADSTRFSTTYCPTDGNTVEPGPDFEYGVLFESDPLWGDLGALQTATSFAYVYGCDWSADNSGAGGPANYIEDGLATFHVDRKTSRLQLDFAAYQYTMPSCLTKTQTFDAPIPFGSQFGSTSIVFNDDGTQFSGTVCDTDGNEYTWTGQDTDAALRCAAVAAQPPADFRDYLSAASPSGSDDLSVQDLASISITNVQTQANGLILDCMLYVMDDDLRKNLFGRSRPKNLPGNVVKTITEDSCKNFLNNAYAPTYIGWGLLISLNSPINSPTNKSIK